MYYFRTRFLLSPMYPRHRKYRFSFLNKRRTIQDQKHNRHIFLNMRSKPSNKSRYTYLRLNADVRRHNARVNKY